MTFQDNMLVPSLGIKQFKNNAENRWMCEYACGMYRGWYWWWLTHLEGRGTKQVVESVKKAIGLLSMVQEGGGKMSASGHYEVVIKIWVAKIEWRQKELAERQKIKKWKTEESPGLRSEGGRRMKKEGGTRTRVGKTVRFTYGIGVWGGKLVADQCLAPSHSAS